MKKFKIYRRKFGGVVSFILKIIVTLLLLGGLFYVIFKLDYFRVLQVEINGAKNFVSSADLEELTKARSLGQPIFTVDKKELENSLERNFQGAKEISISRKLPKTLVVSVTERVPLAVVKDAQDNYYLIDEDGYVLGRVDQAKTNLPKVNYDKDISVGYVLEPELVSVFLSLLSVLDENKILISDLTVTQNYLSFYVDKGFVKVLISNVKNEKESVETLSSLLEKLASEGKEPGLIDLRYDKVVVSYK